MYSRKASKYVSIILNGDANASATVRLDYRLSGMINGKRCTGAYLSQLVASRPGGTAFHRALTTSFTG